MSRIVRSTLIATVASFALAVAAIAAPAKSATKSMTHSVVGTIQKYDSASKALTLHTANGTETITLADSTKVMSGSKAASASDLSANAGSRVKVAYKDEGGQKIAQNVRIATASKPSTKAGTPKASMAPSAKTGSK
jgi:hypothetical protein